MSKFLPGFNSIVQKLVLKHNLQFKCAKIMRIIVYFSGNKLTQRYEDVFG